MTAIGLVVAARREAFYAALESDDFQQCHMDLERKLSDGSIGHCCLGVATRVAMAEGLPLVARETNHTTSFFRKALCDCFFRKALCDCRDGCSMLPLDAVDGVLHPDVQEWYRFVGSDPVIGGTKASDCNDGFRENFGQIAARFRATFPADPASEV